jgi:hypothetical protein
LPRWALLIVVAYLTLVGLLVLARQHSGAQGPPACLFRRVTGHPCPTCGTTRVVLAAAGGRWGEAVAHNPLIFGLAVAGLMLLAVRLVLRRRIVWITSARSRRVLTFAFVAAVLANWVYLLVTQ